MRESLGSAFLINIIIIFIIVFMSLFATSTSYTKAYKIKNQIINMIEEHNGKYSSARKDIETFLEEAGYRVNGNGRCPDGENLVTSNLNYCVNLINETENKEKITYHYKITAFMHFEIPIVGSLVEIPVSGETKSFGVFTR